MALPLSTTPDDIRKVASFLSRKPSGASIQDAATVLGASFVDSRKLSTYQLLGMITRENGRIKLTGDTGRALSRATNEEFARLLRHRLALVAAYRKCLEWAFHKELTQLTNADVGAFWHDHEREELGTDNEREIAMRATCFLQLAAGAGLGEFLIGRRGGQTRLELDRDAIEAFVQAAEFDPQPTPENSNDPDAQPGDVPASSSEPEFHSNGSSQVKANGHITDIVEAALGQAIFVGHGKNKKPLDQLKRILDQFKIPFKTAVEEPNLGRPIGEKVRETMRGCNCAILIFTADEEFRDVSGNAIWRPSENVVHELGASSYLYGNRIVILKEDCIVLPSNFRDLGYISFSKDQLEAKALDVIRELIGFGIVKITT